jgi:mono/diheme cytochrome c family protein
MHRSIPVIIAGFFVASAIASFAGGGPSVEQGKALFNSTSLGTNGKSCSTCHPEGKKLGGAAAEDVKYLEAIINRCIVGALKGSALPSGSSDLTSLALYLKTLDAASSK